MCCLFQTSFAPNYIFLPLVVLLYFHFINERIVQAWNWVHLCLPWATFQPAFNQKKQIPVWHVCCPNHNLRYIPNNSLLHMIGNYYFWMGMCKVVFAAIDVLSIKCTLFLLWLRKTWEEAVVSSPLNPIHLLCRHVLTLCILNYMWEKVWNCWMYNKCMR